MTALSVDERAFDKAFDDGESIMGFLDVSTAQVVFPEEETRHVDLVLPARMVESLDVLAGQLSVSRQALLQSWVAEGIEKGTLAS